MKFGQTIAAGYGSPENRVQTQRAFISGSAYRCYMTPASGDAAYWQLYIDNAQVALFNTCSGIASGEAGPFRVSCGRSANGPTAPAICYLRLGHAPDSIVDFASIARLFDAAGTNQAVLQWPWPYSIIGCADSQRVCSGFSLGGVERAYTDMAAQQDWRAQRYAVAVTSGLTSGSLANLFVKWLDKTLAQGSVYALSGGVVNVAPQSGYAVSGTAYVAPGLSGVCSGAVFVAYPASMRVGKSDVLSGAVTWMLSGANEIINTGQSGKSIITSGAASGSWFWWLASVDDSKQASAPAYAGTTTVTPPPLPPSNLTVLSGSAAAGLFCKFSGQPSVYRLYSTPPGGGVEQLAATQSGGNVIVLPAAFCSGYPGNIALRLVSVMSGIESPDLVVAQALLDGTGNLIAQPPGAAFVRSAVASGLSWCNVVATLAHNTNPATGMLLYRRLPQVASGSVISSGGLTSGQNGYTFSGSAFLTAGVQYFSVQAYANPGGTLGPLSPEVPVVASINLPALSGTATAGRG